MSIQPQEVFDAQYDKSEKFTLNNEKFQKYAESIGLNQKGIEIAKKQIQEFLAGLNAEKNMNQKRFNLFAYSPDGIAATIESSIAQAKNDLVQSPAMKGTIIAEKSVPQVTQQSTPPVIQENKTTKFSPTIGGAMDALSNSKARQLAALGL